MPLSAAISPLLVKVKKIRLKKRWKDKVKKIRQYNFETNKGLIFDYARE